MIYCSCTLYQLYSNADYIWIYVPCLKQYKASFTFPLAFLQSKLPESQGHSLTISLFVHMHIQVAFIIPLYPVPFCNWNMFTAHVPLPTYQSSLILLSEVHIQQVYSIHKRHCILIYDSSWEWVKGMLLFQTVQLNSLVSSQKYIFLLAITHSTNTLSHLLPYSEFLSGQLHICTAGQSNNLCSYN